MKKLLVLFALVLSACGGAETAESADTVGEGSQAPPATEAPASDSTEAPTTQPPATEAPADEPAAERPGGITLTIGDETWEFEGASCAFVNAEPGQDGSEWNVSYITDGAQVYVADDAFGILVEYADISNGGNPNFSWEAAPDGLSISVAGNDISVTGQFTDSVGGTGPIAGTLSATCPGWAQG